MLVIKLQRLLQLKKLIDLKKNHLACVTRFGKIREKEEKKKTCTIKIKL